MDAIERRDVRRKRRMDEIERIEAIDRLADRMLDNPKNDAIPATEVWDMARDFIDCREKTESEWQPYNDGPADAERRESDD
jgi:hypothetical protein